MSQKLLKYFVYASGIVCLVVFLSIRIVPEKFMNAFLKVKTLPEYEDSTKYGELYYMSMVNEFKEELPPASRKYRFSPEHPELNKADVIVYGDSYFDFSRQKTLPELLSEKLSKKVYFERINEPFWGNVLSYLATNNYKKQKETRLLIYGTSERYIYERFIQPSEPVKHFQEKKFYHHILNDFLFLSNTEYLYRTFLKRSYLTHDVYSGIATFKFKHFNYINATTPEYYIDEKNGSWVFYREAVDHYNTKYSDEEIKQIVSSIGDLKTKLKELYNIELLFLPVPDKYNIFTYKMNPEESNSFLPRLYRELNKTDIPYINLFDDYKSMNDGVYYKTDTHWNEKGVNICLKKVLDKIQ